jgi:S1-C subfamily serine protease
MTEENQEQRMAHNPNEEWSYPRKPRRAASRKWSVALVGVVALGTLLYASDANNWFSNPPTKEVNLTSTSNIPKSNTSDTNAGVDSQVVRPGNISSIVQTSSPAVVKIETYTKANTGSNGFGDSFFDQFLSGDQATNGQGMLAAGIGTGFIFDKAGYILTNQHVIEGADQVQVTVEGYAKPFVAKVLGSTFDLDLAVLKINGSKNFSALPLGDDTKVSVGDWLVAIGNPYGFDHTVTVGVLSAKERPITIPENNSTRRYKHLLQTDASINPGNSGGPLLNLNGEVVGINTAVSSEAQGIGFAIPMSTVNSVLTDLKNNRKIPKPYIGIYMSDIDANWLSELKLDSTDGVFIQSVIQDSPAAAAGIKAYDVIVKFNGVAVKNADGLADYIASVKVGEKVQLTLMRDGKPMKRTLIVGNQNQ